MGLAAVGLEDEEEIQQSQKKNQNRNQSQKKNQNQKKTQKANSKKDAKHVWTEKAVQSAQNQRPKQIQNRLSPPPQHKKPKICKAQKIHKTQKKQKEMTNLRRS